VPARIVTGYQGGEPNPLDGYWVVRQSDAHAWTEVWLQGRGWVRVDPTSVVAPGRTGSFQRLLAPRGVLASAMETVSPTLWAHLRAGWEALNNGWNQWILNYTQSRQLNMLRNLGFSSPSWEDLARVLIALIVIVAVAGALWTWWDRLQHDPWLRLLGRVRRRLRQHGLEVGNTAPPRAIAQLVTDRFGNEAQELAQWLLQLEAQRYARAPRPTLSALRREFHRIPWPA
jgi:transglutaminase-like putative cysteine protease